ncbi:MAG: hydrogenase maturation nickel metallochaperone HypA [Planctomycetales bacterium]|nr:hydrogenase maturation nickel metallochaperone HypA [Planctomycetales bacterium]
MHERSLVRLLLHQIIEAALKNSLAQGNCSEIRVRKVVVACGELSGVEPELVSLAFNEMRGSTDHSGVTTDQAELEIRRQPILARCIECGFEFKVEDFEFLCPTCRSTNNQVLAGEDFHLQTIDIELDNRL